MYKLTLHICHITIISIVDPPHWIIPTGKTKAKNLTSIFEKTQSRGGYPMVLYPRPPDMNKPMADVPLTALLALSTPNWLIAAMTVTKGKRNPIKVEITCKCLIFPDEVNLCEWNGNITFQKSIHMYKSHHTASCSSVYVAHIPTIIIKPSKLQSDIYCMKQKA